MSAAASGALPLTARWVAGGRFPRLIADLTPTELSAIIGRRVDSVAVLDGATGTSSRARLGLTGYDVPASVFVKKMSADSAGIRMLGGSWRRSVRPRLGSIANWHRNSVREFHVRTARRSTV